MEELINKNSQLIKEIIETLPNIQQSIDDVNKNYQYYIGSIKNEVFKIKENETYSEAIKRGEGIFDRIDETERRRKLVIEKSQETINQIEILKNKMTRIIEECNNDEATLSKTRNELIDKVISIEEMIMKNKIFKIPEETDTITSEFNKKKEEWFTYYSDYLERKKRKEEELSNTDVSEPNKPIEGSIRLKSHEEGKLKIYLYPNEPFNQIDENDAISILVVGETGSGKTTLLNSFINALYGIRITDDFRYIIINEGDLEQYGDKSVSQRSQVTIYNIKRTKRTPPIKIIDTPGFGDTRGIEWDKEIIKQIEETIETKVLDLNAICFVVPSNNVRLTASQKYIFENIINLFGKDMKKNFIAMFTFCDGEKPQIINALQSKDCMFSTIIPEIDNPWYLKFNNSAIYDDNTEDEFTQMFWKLCMKNFDDFITKLVTLPRISLEKSREVLKRREQIKTQLEGLRISLNNGLSKMNEIKQTYKQLYLNRDKVKNNEDFTFTVDIPVQKIVDLKSGEYATNCNKCHKTCHHPCHVPSLISYFTNKLCTCIGFSGYCKVCGCHSSEHVNESRKYEYVIVKEEQTAQEVFDRYNEGKKGVANAESMLKKLEEEYYKIQMECYDKEQEIVECVNKLSEIALNNKVTSSNEYLDMFIQTENEEKKDGYKVRIEGYKKLKQVNEMIEDIMKNSTTKKSKEEIKAEFEEWKS
ncbi:hypothetical protein ENUP19_0098G0022 [Entamoeba nuttalli]|uniref:AIG1-type G domain-containing protein n=1 Tax=Entamoeba nuttalli TaxID=412467 RepID=A0ABQ0DH81_9EUKA